MHSFRPMPEEINRLVTDRVSDYLFAPSADAVANLRAEGYSQEQIYLVGNVTVDTLLANAGRAASRGTLAGLGLRPRQYGLVTLHRPANMDDPAVLGVPDGRQVRHHVLGEGAAAAAGAGRNLTSLPAGAARSSQGGRSAAPCRAPSRSADHPADRVSRLHRAGSVGAAGPDRLRGAQEESTVFGVPCLTLRDSTERPITLTEGTNQLVGWDPDRIVKAVGEVLAARVPGQASQPYGTASRATDSGGPSRRT